MRLIALRIEGMFLTISYAQVCIQFPDKLLKMILGRIGSYTSEHLFQLFKISGIYLLGNQFHLVMRLYGIVLLSFWISIITNYLFHKEQ